MLIFMYYEKVKKIFIIFLIFLCMAFDAYFIEPNILIEKNKTLNIPNWSEGLNGLSIAVISDLHIGAKNVKIEKLEKIVEKVNQKNPDLIFILGDYDALYINKTYTPQEVSNMLKKFKSKYGVISILGNHDYYPNKVVKNCLENTDIILLENESIYLNIQSQKLKITGLKDFWYFPKTQPKEIIGKADSPTIVLSHNPDLFTKIPKETSLTLSGHTHGGEIIFPYLGSPFIPSEYGQRFNKGYIIEDGKHLFVTSGIAATSGFRFLNLPEIVFLTLNSETKPQKDTRLKMGFKKNYQPLYAKIARMIIKKLNKINNILRISNEKILYNCGNFGLFCKSVGFFYFGY